MFIRLNISCIASCMQSRSQHIFRHTGKVAKNGLGTRQGAEYFTLFNRYDIP